jgi:hypothetical protein
MITVGSRVEIICEGHEPPACGYLGKFGIVMYVIKSDSGIHDGYFLRVDGMDMDLQFDTGEVKEIPPSNPT